MTDKSEADSRLVGTWRSRLEQDGVEGGIFRIVEDLRYVAIFADRVPPREGGRWLAYRNICSVEGPGELRFRQPRTDVGRVLRYWFEGETLVFGTMGDGVARRWKCERIGIVPDWFEEECDKAMKRPWYQDERQ